MVSVRIDVEDIESRYEGDLTRFPDDYVSTQLQDAIDYADSRWRAKIESRLASGELTPNLYRRTIVNAVLRVLRNPQGFASENDGQYGYTTRANVASGALGFTDDDIETLIGPTRTVVPGSRRLGLERGWGR